MAAHLVGSVAILLLLSPLVPAQTFPQQFPQPFPREEPAKPALEKLRARVQELEAQIRLLRDQEVREKAQAAKAERYMKAVAETFLDAVLKKDDPAIAGLLGKDLKEYMSEGNPNKETAALNLASRVRDFRFRDGIASFKVTECTLSPDHDEMVARGTLEVGKDTPGKSARFTIRVVKNKETGRYEIWSLSVKDN